MHIKKILVASALISIASCETTEYRTASVQTAAPSVSKPDISFRCFKDSDPCKDQIGIVNNSKTRSANVNIYCPDKKNPKANYALSTGLTLDPDSFKCVTKEDIRNYCSLSYGFFIGDNVDITVTSNDVSKWEKKKTCTWD